MSPINSSTIFACLQGSFCGDAVCSMYCAPCMLCQMYKELRDVNQLDDKCCPCACSKERECFCNWACAQTQKQTGGKRTVIVNWRTRTRLLCSINYQFLNSACFVTKVQISKWPTLVTTLTQLCIQATFSSAEWCISYFDLSSLFSCSNRTDPRRLSYCAD